jgi:hypothetical protein
MAAPASPAAMGLQAAGTAFTAISQYYQAKTQQKISEYNAKLQRMRSGFALEQGQEAVKRQRMKVSGMIGAQRVGFAAQNILLDEGTASDVQQQTAYWGEIDATTIRNNAAMEAWGYEQQGLSYELQGQQAMQQGIGNAVGTVLGGGGDIAKQIKMK